MPGAAKTTDAGKNIYTGDCIIFRYDSNKNNILSNDEVSGFMLSNGQLLILNSPSSLSINTCDASDPKWQAMNNKDRINITAFTMVAKTETINTADLINKIDITLTGASTDGSFSSTLKDSIQLRNLPRVY